MLALLALVHSQQCPPPDATLTQRPWLCEPANGRGADDRGNSDDLSLCLGNGHVVNGTVCPSRWQWYQVATRHWHDVPEYVLIGPSSELLAPIYAKQREKKRFQEVEGYDEDVDIESAKPKRRDPDQPLRAFEGYDAYHIESVSRHLLHLGDLNAEKYGHACCVSFRSAGQRLSQFRTREEIEHSKAQGKVAKAMANAQRGELPNEAEQREIAEAQEVMNKADKAIKDNVRTPLSTAD